MKNSKNESLEKAIISVIFGIMAASMLTLNVLSEHWYNLAISIVIGVIIGISIYSPKAIINALTLVQKNLEERIIINALRKQFHHRPPITFEKVAHEAKMIIIKFTASTIISLLSYGLLIFIIKYYWPYISGGGLALLIFCVLFISHALHQLSSRIKIMARFYDKFKIFRFTSDNQQIILGEILNYIILGFCWHINALVLIAIFTWLIVIVTATLLTIAFSLPLFLAQLARIIGQQRMTAVIALSIVGGGLIGAFINSHIAGIISGLAILSFTQIFKPYKINYKYFINPWIKFCAFSENLTLN